MCSFCNLFIVFEPSFSPKFTKDKFIIDFLIEILYLNNINLNYIF